MLHMVANPRSPRPAWRPAFTPAQLIERLSWLKAPDRGADMWVWWEACDGVSRGAVPRYTGSLDAARLMVPKGWKIITCESATGCTAELVNELPDAVWRREIGSAYLVACALVIAALRIRE